MSAILTILGCGNSEGTPSAGNHWGLCDPAEPKNRRTRPSVAVQSANTTIIIDTGTDFREQLNRQDIRKVDAVLYTHAHSDHVGGIDDLRPFYKRTKQRIPVYGDKATLDELQERFDYQFVEKFQIYPQVLEAHVITQSQLCKPMTIGDISFIPYEQDHGTCKSLGFRFGDIAYSTDLVDLPPESLRALQGIKTWIADGAGYHMPINRVHYTLERLIEANKAVGAKQVYVTHLAPSMDYKKLAAELPSGFAPAYDGLQIPCSYGSLGSS